MGQARGTHQLEGRSGEGGNWSKRVALTNWKVQSSQDGASKGTHQLEGKSEREGNGASKGHLPAGRQVRRGRELE